MAWYLTGAKRTAIIRQMLVDMHKEERPIVMMLVEHLGGLQLTIIGIMMQGPKRI